MKNKESFYDKNKNFLLISVVAVLSPSVSKEVIAVKNQSSQQGLTFPRIVGSKYNLENSSVYLPHSDDVQDQILTVMFHAHAIIAKIVRQNGEFDFSKLASFIDFSKIDARDRLKSGDYSRYQIQFMKEFDEEKRVMQSILSDPLTRDNFINILRQLLIDISHKESQIIHALSLFKLYPELEQVLGRDFVNSLFSSDLINLYDKVMSGWKQGYVLFDITDRIIAKLDEKYTRPGNNLRYEEKYIFPKIREYIFGLLTSPYAYLQGALTGRVSAEAINSILYILEEHKIDEKNDDSSKIIEKIRETVDKSNSSPVTSKSI